MPEQLNLISYQEARRWIYDADLLLHRGRSWYAPFLRSAGRSPYTHASMAAWWHGRVHALQAVYLADPRPLLSKLIGGAEGKVDVYRCHALNPNDREMIVRDMIGLVGEGYSWLDLFWVAVEHAPLLRLIAPPDTNDREPVPPRAFCSQAISSVYASHGHDPVPNLADRATEPGDLARSTLFNYEFTLA